MKKTYMIPQVKEIKIRMEQHIMAGSGSSTLEATEGPGDAVSESKVDGDFGW